MILLQADAEYVLPILRRDRSGESELIGYLQWLSRRLKVTVVDGSDEGLFDALGAGLPTGVQHIRPHRTGVNGKARGVLSGWDVARSENLVIADDDVRYDASSLRALLERLEQCDLVRPQNVYSAYPWHARLDTGRMLMARAFGGDYGGTLGVRASALRRTGGYDADVLFENLELERTIRSEGGRVDIARDLYVARLPPTRRHFWSQRVRQAYDDFAQPLRLLTELSIAPLVLVWVVRRSGAAAVCASLCVMALAETGRRVGGGAAVFRPTLVAWAPIWVLERGVSVWLAIIARLRGGVRYSGRRVQTAATPVRVLRRTPGTGRRRPPRMPL